MWEKALTITRLKEKYSDVLKQGGIDLKTSTVEQIKETIATKMSVPEGISLQPSIFSQWITYLGLRAIPEKPVLSKVVFLNLEKLKTKNIDTSELVFSEDTLERNIKVPAWIPAPGKPSKHPLKIGDPIQGMSGSYFGQIRSHIDNSPFGPAILIKRDVPPSKVINTFLTGLSKKNLSELRFFIAKELNVGEGEVFNAENLWKVNNRERLLLSPHDILSSYYTSDEMLIYGHPLLPSHDQACLMKTTRMRSQP